MVEWPAGVGGISARAVAPSDDTVGGYGLPLAALGLFTLVGAGLFYWGTDPVVGE